MARDAEYTNSPQVTIELRFLSGTSRGQCHHTTNAVISVGDDRTCDVRVPDSLESNERRNVRIQYSNTGWSLRNLGTSMVVVNHTVVARETRLKSGDVIRLSLAGPELMFSIVADRSCLPPSSLPSEHTAVRKEKHIAKHDGLRSSPNQDACPALPEDMEDMSADSLLEPVSCNRLFPQRLSSWHQRLSVRYAVATITTIALLLLVSWMLLRTDHNSVVRLNPIPEQSVDEGQPWGLDISEYVTPSISGEYSFRIAGTFPDGLELNDKTGQLRWTPTESQGPRSYQIQIDVCAKSSNAAKTAGFTILVREVNTPPRLQAVPDMTFGLGTKEALEVQIVAVDNDIPTQPIEFRLGANAPPGMLVDRITGLIRWVPKPEHAGQTFPVEILANDPETVQSPPRLSFRVNVLEPEAEMPKESELAAAIYLLVIEEPASGTVFPFAVAFAVRDDLLLTSGAVVQELANVRNKGMAILAIHCLSQNHEEIASLYLRPDFVRLQDRPDEQIYNDLGAVQLSGTHRFVAPLAAAANSNALEQGTPLRCVMPVFEAEPLTRFDNVTPTSHSAKIYMVTRRGDPTSASDECPRLLSLVGALPKNAFGSPLVNEQGQVVAVYVEKADLSNDESLAGLVDRYHYALSLDSPAGLLDDKMSVWQLVPKEASMDSSRENQ